MTFGDLYTKANSYWDKALSPYLSPGQFNDLINGQYSALCETELARFETDEGYAMNVQYLMMPELIKPNSLQVDKIVDTPNFYKRLAFNLTTIGCNGQPQTFPIDIWSNNQADEMQVDPFNVGIDTEPGAKAKVLSSGNPGWVVFCTSPATANGLSINMTWARQWQAIDITTPNVIFEGPDYVGYWLVARVVARLDVVIESPRSKAEFEIYTKEILESHA